MSLFPIFLKLTGRPCTVIAAGHLAESKTDSPLAAAARLPVIAPQAGARIADLAASGELTLHLRPYAPGALAGQVLGVPAPNLRPLPPPVLDATRQSLTETESPGVLTKAVPAPPFRDFYFPSALPRGDLQIAISTAGES